ncbi:serine/threonine protein kinase [Myxococcus sp. AM011]|uniref:serine/threonine-protein kinase n=1 Tax=Myxococcus sp. AM011 TaxID=2745200 RepID=UPI001594F4D6|nr:serine/threonine-protein kinase [Myxococcus sp. AM011]NVJ27615.1 serine/threonine protein kinase [Myxococcus sp. AM011]
MRDDGPPAVLSPGDVVMGYTVVKQQGRGGFGTVYLATCDGQSYALKLVELRRLGGRVEREISILLRLKHPNVVGIRGFFYWPPVESEFVVIAMSYVEGRQLGVWAKEENPSAREVAQAALGVARALAASHEAGVVHRDVKEANVMVQDADGLAVLVDYGVGAYEGAPGVTLSILPPGTPEFLPPEAWLYLERNTGVRGARYVPGPADDVWALGVLLYRLLTAKVPFEAADTQAFINAVITASPAPPRVANERVPEQLSQVCMRLLEKEPSVRPGARAVCEALEELLAKAEEGASWDVPLCDAYGPDTATTDGGRRDKKARWVNAPLRRPRRGKRAVPARVELVPQPNVAPLDAVHVPAASASPPTEEKPVGPVLLPELPAARQEEGALVVDGVPRPASFRIRSGRVVGAGLLAAALSAGVFLALRPPPPSSPGVQVPAASGQEVAPYTKKPQAAPAAAPTGPEAIPAAVAPPATHPEVTATVTTTKSDSPTSPPVPAKKATRSVSNAVATAALCGALACSGPQVRPAPDPEPCPEGASKGMKMLGMKIGDKEAASFVRGEEKYVTVREGTAQIIVGSDYATLSGRLIIADRVYVRLTRARTSKGTFPVCLEVRDTSNNRGLEIEGGGGESGKARVYSAVIVRAVSEFE